MDLKSLAVAGHANNIVFSEEKIYKNCKQSEIDFYDALYKNMNPINEKLINMIPKYFGFKDSKLELENLLFNIEIPCILDIKIGFQTYFNDYKDDKIKYQKNKDNKSTTSSLGMRFSGFNIKDQHNKTIKKLQTQDQSSIDKETFKQIIQEIINDNQDLKQKLLQLLNWQKNYLKKESEFYFRGTSILIIYDAKNKSNCLVKWIDFANYRKKPFSDFQDESLIKSINIFIDLIKYGESCQINQRENESVQ